MPASTSLHISAVYAHRVVDVDYFGGECSLQKARSGRTGRLAVIRLRQQMSSFPGWSGQWTEKYR